MTGIRIEHIALWASDLELLKDFYIRYFGAEAGKKYINDRNGFSSYFLSFPDSGARLEIMNKSEISENSGHDGSIGFCHIAISTGSKENVDYLTERLRADGIEIVRAPRTTGDGYYESVIRDPEGNFIEITV